MFYLFLLFVLLITLARPPLARVEDRQRVPLAVARRGAGRQVQLSTEGFRKQPLPPSVPSSMQRLKAQALGLSSTLWPGWGSSNPDPIMLTRK